MDSIVDALPEMGSIWAIRAVTTEITEGTEKKFERAITAEVAKHAKKN